MREHSDGIRPPRALWVPFELGRPLGVPNDRDFQMAVLRATLALIEEPVGPVLRDYPVEAPDVAAEDEAWTCALPLPPLPEATSLAEAYARRLSQEISLLRPWYDESVRVRGRTAVGVSGLDANAVDTIAGVLAGIAGGEPPSVPHGIGDGRPWTVRLMADDLKAFYFEAAAAQPRSRPPTSAELNTWLFGETALADVVYAARDALIAHEDAAWQGVGRTLTPAAFAKRPGT